MKTLLAALLLFQGAFSITISGMVLDSTTQKPVPGVNIQVIGTSLGTATDEAGQFTLVVHKSLPVHLQVSHIAFHPITLTVSHAEPSLTIILVPTVIEGQVIEVTGTRPLYKADVSADVDLIAIEDMEIQGAREVGSALRRITSVNIDYTNNGKQTITIRGSNPEDVAVYLDGVKINQANTGIADLSMVDINSLAEIQVIKGGNTTLFGGGNTGGVLNLESRHIMENSLQVKQGMGITFKNDADFSASGTVKKGIVGVGGRYTGMNRAYAGRTITTSLFNTLFSDITFPSGLLSVRWLRLEKALTFPSGGVNLADGMDLVSAKYSGNLPYTGKWELFYGNRTWSNEQDFLTSLKENIRDDTETMRLSKMIEYRVIQSTLQYEREFQQFLGNKTQLDIAGKKIAHRRSRLNPDPERFGWN
ncbi:MAG: TonB-dependent receptor plug domain-containing protein [Fidelibacterota bacterium]